MDQRVARFVERWGIFFEDEGLPRIAGRMIGLLMLSPSPRTLDDIAETLGVSKASVSTDARRMAERGFLQRSSRPGDRRDYYAIAPDGFQRGLEQKIRSFQAMRALCEESRALPITSTVVHSRLDQWEDAHRAFVEAMTSLLSTWQARPASRAPQAGSDRAPASRAPNANGAGPTASPRRGAATRRRA